MYPFSNMGSTSEKLLIVNADDYGTNAARNRGILEAARGGIVTTTSVIANSIKPGDAVSALRASFGTRVGVHLNLTMGTPLSAAASTLVNPSGAFWDKETVWRKALRGDLDLTRVEEEFAAQINHLLTLGIAPDHLDGNNHIHVFPGIAEVTARLGSSFGITRVRLPLEPFARWHHYFRRNSRKKSFMGRLARRAAPVFASHGLRSTETFAGMQFPAMTELESLRAFVANLPCGTTELMCHPGYRDPEAGGFSTAEREHELSVLTNLAVLDDIRRFGIRLISYGDI
jgi:chitin disaccharide deacetylase